MKMIVQPMVLSAMLLFAITGAETQTHGTRADGISQPPAFHSPNRAYSSTADTLLYENFDGPSFPPAGWSRYVVAGDTVAWNRCVAAGNGIACVRWNLGQPMGSKWLVSRRVNLDPIQTYELIFFVRTTSALVSISDTLLVRISTADSLPTSFGQAIYVCYSGTPDTANPHVYGLTWRRFRTLLPPGLSTAFIAFERRDLDGQFIYLDDVSVLRQTVNVTEEDVAEPAEFFLDQNYPNPFNPKTAIGYRLSAVGHVTLRVFDLLGREVATLVDEVKEAGEYSVTFDAGNLPSGVYFYQLKTNGHSQTKKMALIQ